MEILRSLRRRGITDDSDNKDHDRLTDLPIIHIPNRTHTRTQIHTPTPIFDLKIDPQHLRLVPRREERVPVSMLEQG